MGDTTQRKTVLKVLIVTVAVLSVTYIWQSYELNITVLSALRGMNVKFNSSSNVYDRSIMTLDVDSNTSISEQHRKLCRRYQCVIRPRTWNLPEMSVTAVTSDVFFYTDDHSFADNLLQLRNSYNQSTCICVLDRYSLWSFKQVPRMKKALEVRRYPKHYPDTVVPEYGAAMHCKYELMGLAVRANVFGTRYFAWSDVGVFRSLTDLQDFAKVRPFSLAVPTDLDESKVAYTQVYSPNFGINFDTYFRDNHVWVCGCFFVAESSVMLRWTAEYLRFVDLLLNETSSSTDQQVLLSMFNEQFAAVRPNVSVQVYHPRSGHMFNWFYLAHLCRHRGLQLQYNTSSDKQTSQQVALQFLPGEIANDQQPLYNEFR